MSNPTTAELKAKLETALRERDQYRIMQLEQQRKVIALQAEIKALKAQS